MVLAISTSAQHSVCPPWTSGTRLRSLSFSCSFLSIWRWTQFFQGKLDLLACLTEHCQPLEMGWTLLLVLVLRPGLWRCRACVAPAMSAACLGRACEVINAPTKGEAAVWSCTVLSYRITEGDYGGESLNAEIVWALQSSSVLPDLAAAEGWGTVVGHQTQCRVPALVRLES